MASVGIRCGVSDSLQQRLPICSRNRIARPCCSLRLANCSRITMSMRQTVAPEKIALRTYPSIKHGSEDRKREAVVSDKLTDEWMKDSVLEIVKNLREAPLLVHVYSNDDGEDKKKTTLRTENAVEEESWSRIMEEWKGGSVREPEGVIFVEQLKDADEDEEEEEETSTDGVTRAWGVVVQGRGGRGVECGPPTCYLLKTSRAGVGLGMGPCCTHFCLVKVKSFRETTSSQLKNCWLAQGY